MHHQYGIIVPLIWAGLFAGMMVLRHRRKMALIAMGGGQRPPFAAPSPAADWRDAEIAQLRERVRVLERIATAPHTDERRSADLAAQIEALRDR
ncbi:hypothetical protein GTZ99_02840 [Novosphingobium sp. FSY-8]|uniref:Phage shock protein B n=1 Tax=Novosphingobium ovatum TaxID=1908523 RepID=A0ABW9XAD4_9SPHN|nr:hypothetical protein [Novosphingobium ovatum]NBC35488.1 hypothetical protein [Novosphingobium ovatum]